MVPWQRDVNVLSCGLSGGKESGSALIPWLLTEFRAAHSAQHEAVVGQRMFELWRSLRGVSIAAT